MGFYGKELIEPHAYFTSEIGTDTSSTSRCCFFTPEEDPDTNLKGEVLLDTTPVTKHGPVQYWDLLMQITATEYITLSWITLFFYYDTQQK